MKLKDKDYKITYFGNTGTIHHIPSGLRAIREHKGVWIKGQFEGMLRDIMAHMIRDLEDDGKTYKAKCAHCPEPVEAKHYTMCKACWWERDPRNPVNARAAVLQTLMDNMPHHCDMGHKGCTVVHNPLKDIDEGLRAKSLMLAEVVHQNGGLLTDELESRYMRIVEDVRRSMCCSLDEAIAKCYTSEMSSILFKKWLFTLAADIVY